MYVSMNVNTGRKSKSITMQVLRDWEMVRVGERKKSHTRGNQHSDVIVKLFGCKVVVEQECQLHPSLPFLGLLTR